MLRSLLVTTIIGIFALVPLNSTAQESQAAQQTLLPEIDPQDIEIRSQFQARFPGLRRQPILGFNPRPRVFQINPNRTPFIEDEETVISSLPVGGLDRPDAPEFTPLTYADAKNGFVRAGVGSYISPELDAFAITKLGSKSWVSANINHFSTDGHLENLTSSSRDFIGDISLYSVLSGRARLNVDLGVESAFNYFPGLVLENGGPVDAITKAKRLGLLGGARLEISQTPISGFEISLDGYSSGFDLNSEFQDIEGTATEWGVNSKAEYSRLGKNIQEVHRVRFTNSTGSTDLIGLTGQSWSVSNLSAHYERLFDYQTDVKAELGVSGVTDALNDFRLYVSPRFSFAHTLIPGLDLRLRLMGKPTHTTYRELQLENPFLDLTVPLQHQYEWRGSAEIETEPFRGTKLMAGASFQNIKNFIYYTRNANQITGTNFTEGYYRPEYDRANIFKVYGGFTQDLTPSVLWVKADGYWQIPRISGNQKIPFIESYGIKSSVSYRPFKQLILEGWGEFIGGREDSFGNSLSSFILLGSRFEISLSSKMGVYGKLINLTGEEFELWQGYPERGFQGFVGVTYLF